MLLGIPADSKYAMTVFDRNEKLSTSTAESNKTRISTNIFYVWIQEEIRSKFYSISRRYTETLQQPDDVGKVMAYREVVYDGDHMWCTERLCSLYCRLGPFGYKARF
jgi:hypothetical protein